MTSNRMTNTHIIRQIISALMAILMFVCSYLAVPAQVLADGLALQDAVRAYNAVNDFSGNTAMPYSSLMGEEEGLRGEATRTFRRADGMSETVIYGGAVAYMTEEGYALIDNTLVKAGEGYANKASDFRVTFHQTTETEELVRLEAGGSLLSWFLGGFHFGEELTEELPVEEAIEDDASEQVPETREPVTDMEPVTEEPEQGTDIPENVPAADETPADTEEQPATGEDAAAGEAVQDPTDIMEEIPVEVKEATSEEEANTTDGPSDTEDGTAEETSAADTDEDNSFSNIEDVTTTVEETAGETNPVEEATTTDELPTEVTADTEEDATEEAITDETMLPLQKKPWGKTPSSRSCCRG